MDAQRFVSPWFHNLFIITNSLPFFYSEGRLPFSRILEHHPKSTGVLPSRHELGSSRTQPVKMLPLMERR